MAFTGNKFEFRAVGAIQSCAGSNVALNTIVAWGIDQICTELEKALKDGGEFNASLGAILKRAFGKHQRIIFDGDNYSAAWREEAARRGLPCAASTPAALEALRSPETVELFTKYGVFTERELLSRHEIYSDTYDKTIMLEATCALRMARTLIIPAGLSYAAELRQAGDEPPLARLSKRVRRLVLPLIEATDELENAIAGTAVQDALKRMNSARAAADELETLVPTELWPLPTNAEMLLT